MTWRRILIYWVLSTCAAGVVAGLARFPTYAGNVGSFMERFLLYTFPFPMALGMLHLPVLAVGTLVCLTFRRPFGRHVTTVLCFLLALALLGHLVMHVAGRDHWGVFAFLTVDIAILAVIGLLSRRRPQATPQSRA